MLTTGLTSSVSHKCQCIAPGLRMCRSVQSSAPSLSWRSLSIHLGRLARIGTPTNDASEIHVPGAHRKALRFEFMEDSC